MKKIISSIAVFCLCLFTLTACGGYKTKKIGSVPLNLAQQEIPEEQLMDVGIVAFTSEELETKEAKKEGTNPEIRKAEQHYIPYHLKHTLQHSSYWGAVRLIPENDEGLDVTVKGNIVRSNGEDLELKIEVLDASGKTWFRNQYRTKASRSSYVGNVAGEKDPFQSLYNAIANDMAALKRELEQKDIDKVRAISQLKFAQEFVPEAFSGHLENDDNSFSINRMPADNDPLMERVLRIRQRDYMFIDTLNEYYENFYNEMWAPYHSWRDANLEEQTALREVRRKAFIRRYGGAALVAIPIVFGGVFGIPFIGAFMDPLVLTGGKMMDEGKQISGEAELHSVAIQELSETFGANMKPVTMEFQGKQYTLTGTATEQYERWKDLMRRIYVAETTTQDISSDNETGQLIPGVDTVEESLPDSSEKEVPIQDVKQ
jgi:hypothetical protein